MINTITKKFDFLHSALAEKNEFHSKDYFFKWFHNTAESNTFLVNEIPFEELDQWYFEKETKNLKHASGKFFSIEGLNVFTNFGRIQKWEQPIIIQPEIGILGIITKKINGIRYFLMQAKMEPGNVNIIQLSPTVQATRSNFTKVHKGKLPKYLEYFTDKTKSNILIDLLQPEQGGRFFKKRNRNMIVEITDEIILENDFIWLTLAEIKELLKIDNLVNMDARSVLATIPFIDEDKISEFNELLTTNNKLFNNINLNPIAIDILTSAACLNNALNHFNNIINWITEMKTRYEIHAYRIPLINVNQWNFSENEIYHQSKRFFSVIGVKVKAGTREVMEWTQPLLKDTNYGLIGFIVKKINGILHFLVQAKVEPGGFDIIELAPTVSCSNYEYVIKNHEKPPFIEYFVKAPNNNIVYSKIQSEEGGRFYHFQNKNMIVLTNDDLIIPDNYSWMTLAQIMKLMKFGYLNIESRSILSSLSLL